MRHPDSLLHVQNVHAGETIFLQGSPTLVIAVGYIHEDTDGAYASRLAIVPTLSLLFPFAVVNLIYNDEKHFWTTNARRTFPDIFTAVDNFKERNQP